MRGTESWYVRGGVSDTGDVMEEEKREKKGETTRWESVRGVILNRGVTAAPSFACGPYGTVKRYQ